MVGAHSLAHDVLIRSDSSIPRGERSFREEAPVPGHGTPLPRSPHPGHDHGAEVLAPRIISNPSRAVIIRSTVAPSMWASGRFSLAEAPIRWKAARTSSAVAYSPTGGRTRARSSAE